MYWNLGCTILLGWEPIAAAELSRLPESLWAEASWLSVPCTTKSWLLAKSGSLESELTRHSTSKALLRIGTSETLASKSGWSETSRSLHAVASKLGLLEEALVLSTKSYLPRLTTHVVLLAWESKATTECLPSESWLRVSILDSWVAMERSRPNHGRVGHGGSTGVWVIASGRESSGVCETLSGITAHLRAIRNLSLRSESLACSKCVSVRQRLRLCTVVQLGLSCGVRLLLLRSKLVGLRIAVLEVGLVLLSACAFRSSQLLLVHIDWCTSRDYRVN